MFVSKEVGFDSSLNSFLCVLSERSGVFTESKVNIVPVVICHCIAYINRPKMSKSKKKNKSKRKSKTKKKGESKKMKYFIGFAVVSICLVLVVVGKYTFHLSPLARLGNGINCIRI